ncbi:hypothetical protein HDV62DRAFT_373566 [Trichoderma sp. SZMC 28011]
MEHEPSAQGATISDNRLHSTTSAGEYLVCSYGCAIMFHVATSLANSEPTEQTKEYSHKFMGGVTDYEVWLIFACVFELMYWNAIGHLFRQLRWADHYLPVVVWTTGNAVFLWANFIEGDLIGILQGFHLIVIGCASICFVIDKCINYLTSRSPSSTFRRAPKMHV